MMTSSYQQQQQEPQVFFAPPHPRTTRPFVPSIQAMNSQGVELLCLGHYDDAIRMFLHCTSVLQEKLQEHSENHPHNDDTTMINGLQIQPFSIEENHHHYHQVTLFAQQQQQQQATPQEPPTDHNILTPCVTAFQLVIQTSTSPSAFATPTTAAAAAGTGSDYCCSAALLSAALLYNLGLAKHMKALQRKRGYERASRIYRMAFAATTKDEGDQTTSTSMVVVLAIANNLAHLSYQLFDTELCRSCCQTIREVLPGASSSSFSASSSCPSSLLSSSFQAICLMNTMIVLLDGDGAGLLATPPAA